jgi:cell division protein FtsB
VRSTVIRRAAQLALLSVAAYYAVWGGEYSAPDLLRLHGMTIDEAERLDAARLELDSLRAHVADLETEPATIERLARERFGMIRPGETLYRFVRVESPPAQTVAGP